MTNPSPLKCQDIILIHGLYQNSFVMKRLGKGLTQLGYRVHYFDYPTLKKPLNENVTALNLYLTPLKHPYALIGHSLGALLIFHALNTQIPAQLQSVITITPPFHGSRIVEYLAEHHSDFLVGKAAATLLPKETPISWNFPIPLGIIAGTQNSGPSALLLETLTNTIDKDSLIGDGTVYLDETTINGYTDFITLPKSHTMILFDNAVPKLCDRFIQHHHF